MAEKLTKKALKNELDRRLEWLEDNYKFSPNYIQTHSMSRHISIMYGRYLALREMRRQIEAGVFIGGFIC